MRRDNLDAKRYKLLIEYDGTNYSGWQKQINSISIQEKIESALSTIFNSKITVVGSGRTDTGVHAKGQVAHFDVITNTEYSSSRIMHSLNGLLPWDIKIKDCNIVDHTFHSQYSAKRKTYRYSVYLSNTICPLKHRYAEMTVPTINLEKMQNSSLEFLGVHDFKGFSGSLEKSKNTIREIYRIEISKNDDNIFFEITGNGFLYKMVRFLVGHLIAIGLSKIDITTIKDILRDHKRSINIIPAPARGLCLMSVDYLR
ncbi:MAG: tRNA pseudouridine(38-40) synthase TruA [Christensenellaceae bacterium]|jgi:tRNA pseudouridine38-40 synthase|nr:tRNA pseudouridine(38-40) synthase TruA [Christensenellaceae bacterium]